MCTGMPVTLIQDPLLPGLTSRGMFLKRKYTSFIAFFARRSVSHLPP